MVLHTDRRRSEPHKSLRHCQELAESWCSSGRISYFVKAGIAIVPALQKSMIVGRKMRGLVFARSRLPGS